MNIPQTLCAGLGYGINAYAHATGRLSDAVKDVISKVDDATTLGGEAAVVAGFSAIGAYIGTLAVGFTVLARVEDARDRLSTMLGKK